MIALLTWLAPDCMHTWWNIPGSGPRVLFFVPCLPIRGLTLPIAVQGPMYPLLCFALNAQSHLDTSVRVGLFPACPTTFYEADDSRHHILASDEGIVRGYIGSRSDSKTVIQCNGRPRSYIGVRKGCASHLLQDDADGGQAREEFREGTRRSSDDRQVNYVHVAAMHKNEMLLQLRYADYSFLFGVEAGICTPSFGDVMIKSQDYGDVVLDCTTVVIVRKTKRGTNISKGVTTI